MPELPEVETVRRGLAPAMEDARFSKVEVRRPDLRWPLPRNFARRLHGQTVTGLGRRAKYLLADLSSGDVLLMHLGMSGSFHVFQKAASDKLGTYHRERKRHLAHDHVVFHMSSGSIVTFNDPRRFGSMKLVARAKLDAEPLLARLGPEPLCNAFDAAMLAQACPPAQRPSRTRCWRGWVPNRLATRSMPRCWLKPAGEKRRASKRHCWISASSPGSATSMSARRCIVRGYRPCASPRPLPTAAVRPTSARNGWSKASRPCSM